jgi:PqqD family protein of HPr-rel-A system
MSMLPRVRTGLLKHPLDKQVLVYDSSNGQVHLLDPTTACVLDLLQEGGWTREGMTIELAERNKVSEDPGFVTLALEELRKSGLLEESEHIPAPLEGVTRRDMVGKLAMAGAAAILVPAVSTLTTSRAYAQGQSIAGGGGSGCTSSLQCGPGLICCQGSCQATCQQPPGGPCPGGNIECQSGICCSGVCASVPCGSVGSCGNCQANPDCQGGVCSKFGSCGTGNDADKSPNGASCNGNGNCCSNHCTNGTCTPT